MKNYIYILFVLSPLLFLTSKIYGQGTVVAHAFAQVIDGASISSNAITELSMNSAENNSELDLGEIIIKTGSSSSCDIMLKPANLTNRLGKTLTLETTASNLSQLSSTSSNNSKLALTGNASAIKGERGTYQGSYTVVLAYN